MRWGDYIKRTAVRRVIWVVVGLAVYAVLSALGVAHAQTAGVYPSRQEAYSACLAEVASAPSNWNPGNPCVVDWSGQPRYCINAQYSQPPFSNLCSGYTGSQNWFRWQEECPGGGDWREDLNRCFDPEECLNRNDNLRSGNSVQTFTSGCVDGCEMAPKLPNSCSSIIGDGTKLCAGRYEYTGEACSVPPPAQPPEPDGEEQPDKRCVPASHNQSFCVRDDGKNCYTASTGREICWNPGETGEKADGDILQARNAGPNEIPLANPNLPNGDTLSKTGDSITVETQTNRPGGSSTTTTTTTNYETQYGTSPGPRDEGHDADGAPAEGEGDGEEKGTVSGGGSCDDPPIARGGDAVVAAIVDQAWLARCAIEAGNSAEVTGDVGNCAEPFHVEGDNANAHQLRAMREQICGEYKGAERQGVSDSLEGAIGAMEGEFDGIFGEGEGAGSIVTTRYGSGGSCPVIEITIPGIGQTWTPPPIFCSIIAALRLLFIAVATVWALRIIGS